MVNKIPKKCRKCFEETQGCDRVCMKPNRTLSKQKQKIPEKEAPRAIDKNAQLIQAIKNLANCECDRKCLNCPAKMKGYKFAIQCIRNEARKMVLIHENPLCPNCGLPPYLCICDEIKKDKRLLTWNTPNTAYKWTRRPTGE